MLQLEVLILELLAIDRLAACTVSFCKITTLDHKVLNDSMERGTLVPKTLLTSSKSSEVLSCLCVWSVPDCALVQWHSDLWYSLAIKAKHYPTHILISVLDIEVDLMSDLGALSRLCSLTKEEENSGQNDHQRHNDLL